MYVTEQLLLLEHTDLSPYVRCKSKFKSCIIKSHMTKIRILLDSFQIVAFNIQKWDMNQLENNGLNQFMWANNTLFPPE